MFTTAILRGVVSTRYIFLLSGLTFILWSLAVSVVPKASPLSALFQMDLDQSTINATEAQQPRNTSLSDVPTQNNLNIRPHRGIGIPHAHVYVISPANRQDRREQMEFLRRIQDLTWTVTDAVPRNAMLVNRILQWVAFQRAEGKKTGTSSFCWPEEINALSASHATPLSSSGSDTWVETSPRTKSKSDRSDLLTSSRVPCSTEDDAIPAVTKDTPKWMILSPSKIACWDSHISTIRQFIDGRRGQNDVAVILEDDIDMEKDISRRLSQVWTFLPAGWDIVFLGTYNDTSMRISEAQVNRFISIVYQGHCWSNESSYPPLTGFTDMNLHPSYYPKCTHAYALSLSGARRLL